MKTPGELFLEKMKVNLANMSDEEFIERFNAVCDDEDNSMTVEEYLQQIAGHRSIKVL